MLAVRKLVDCAPPRLFEWSRRSSFTAPLKGPPGGFEADDLAVLRAILLLKGRGHRTRLNCRHESDVYVCGVGVRSNVTHDVLG